MSCRRQASRRPDPPWDQRSSGSQRYASHDVQCGAEQSGDRLSVDDADGAGGGADTAGDGQAAPCTDTACPHHQLGWSRGPEPRPGALPTD